MKRVLVSPAELWDYYNENADDLVYNMHLVAENPDIGITIYVQDENGLATLSVLSDDALIDERVFNKFSAVQIANQLYSMLDGVSTEYVEDEDLIYEREDELSDALDSFLVSVLSATQASEVTEDIRQDILDGVLRYLATNGFSIYRPTKVGNELDLYPYAE